MKTNQKPIPRCKGCGFRFFNGVPEVCPNCKACGSRSGGGPAVCFDRPHWNESQTSKHTPGGWTREFDDEGQWMIHGDDPTNTFENYNFAAVYIDGSDPTSVTKADASSRLICAAPDLLAALKAVVRVADRATDEFDAARAAIAKAEGR